MTQGAAIICTESIVEWILISLAENLFKKFFQISRPNPIVVQRKDLVVRETYMLEHAILAIQVGANICREDIAGFYIFLQSTKMLSFFGFDKIVQCTQIDSKNHLETIIGTTVFIIKRS